MMKRMVAVLFAAALLISLTACGGTDPSGSGSVPAESESGYEDEAQEGDAEKLQIVTTIFPEYDWVREIVGDAENVEISLLLKNGVDMHSYQPTVDDMMLISACDVFIYVGGESDGWVIDALKTPQNPDRIVISLMGSLGDAAKAEEHVEGMEEEEEEEEEPAGTGEPVTEYDEHVWLSLRNAKTLVTEIAKVLIESDPDNASDYTSNSEAYLENLSALDGQFQSVTESSEKKTLLFGDRFPFRYLTDDYGLDYYAAFAGCSAETEASFETVVFLADKVNELGLDTILIIDGSDGSIAKTIRDNTDTKDQTIAVLDSMQSVTEEDMTAGASYLGIMESNLEVLKEALGE